MAQGKLTKQEAQHAKKCVDEIFTALPKSKRMNFIGHLNDVFLFLDEAPGSYKDIETVMAEQADLVDILVKLEPLGVVKG
jgi:tRNA-splicing ligase RtcB